MVAEGGVMMILDFGFDLAGRSDARLWRGAALSAVGAMIEAVPLGVAFVVLDGVFRGAATWAWLPWTILTLLAAFAASTVLKTFGGIDSFIATYGLVCDARLRLVDHLRRLPMGFWNAQRTGSVSSVVTDEFALYTESVTHTWSLVVVNLAKPLTLALVLTIVDWRLGLVGIATFPLALASIPWSHRLLNRASDRLADTKARAHARLFEFAAGAGTLREYGQVGPFHARLGAVLEELESEQMRTELAPAPAIFVYKLLIGLGFSALVAAGVWGVAHDRVDPSHFLLVALLSLQLFDSAADLWNHLAVARFASRTLERIRSLFTEPPQLDVSSGPSPGDATVRLERVSFGYAGCPAISEVSAVFKPGTVTALVGPSGSGKSTLAHLITRLWDVDEGRVTIGGIDARAMPLSELHRRVSTVLQDVVLFRETVEDNIRLGRPTATRDEVVAAAKAARAHDFIEGLPDGYDTVLGEGGSDLSGGQRQRISVARALLHDAPILVLDEATSSVDSHNELQIQQAISELTRGRTVVVIAHRLWTIRHADQILVLDRGCVVERGTHAELVERDGVYHKLWTAQQSSHGWRLGH